MNRRNAWIAVAVIAVIALVIVVGLQQRPETVAVPSPSPTLSLTPNATATGTPAPTASTGASASPAAAPSTSIYKDAFGFLVTGGDGPPHAVIYMEGSDVQLWTIVGSAVGFSPDGKQLAYWTLSTSGSELHVFTVGTKAEQTLVTLTGDQRAGGVVWSNDGAALLYSTESGSAGVGGGANSATLHIWELAANGRHGATIDTQTNTGWLYRPIAWDRSTNLAAVQLTGEGGFMGQYETVRLNADGSFNVSRVDTTGRSMPMGSIRASSDAKLVLGVNLAGDITWWPIDNFGAAKSQAGAGKRGAQWRPGTHEIGFVGPSDQFWLGDVDKAGALGLCCTAFSGVPASSTLATFRADGTAVVLGVPAPSRQFGADYTLVRFGSDPKATSGDRVTFPSLTGLFASVRFR